MTQSGHSLSYLRGFKLGKEWRVHGARGGGPKGKRNGNYKHGLYTNEAIEERRALSALLRASRDSLDAISSEEDR